LIEKGRGEQRGGYFQAREVMGVDVPARRRLRPLLWPLLGVVIASGCATFERAPFDPAPFRERAETQVDDNVRLSAAVLGAAETEQVFGLDLYRRGIQPVWLEIENNAASAMRVLPVATDPEYFTPLEVSYIHRFRFAKQANEAMDDLLEALYLSSRVEPGTTQSGFLFTHMDRGTKVFNVDIMGSDHDLRRFTFMTRVPGFQAEHRGVDWAALYSPRDIVSHDRDGLRRALGSLPCCVRDAQGDIQPEPLNAIIVGAREDVFYSLVRSGWDDAGSYDAENESYVFRRQADAIFQRTGPDQAPRFRLRLWLTPLTLEDSPVWVAQVGREPGPRQKTPATVDTIAARLTLFQDLLYAQSLMLAGHVKRGEVVSQPQVDDSGDSRLILDGYRIVLGVSSEPVALPDLEYLPWDMLAWE
jgi:hypothetical protein